jgi:hypothetical protein
MDVPKQMSEDRIGGPRPARKEVEGLPEAFGRGNRMKARLKPGELEKVTKKQQTF